MKKINVLRLTAIAAGFAFAVFLPLHAGAYTLHFNVVDGNPAFVDTTSFNPLPGEPSGTLVVSDADIAALGPALGPLNWESIVAFDATFGTQSWDVADLSQDGSTLFVENGVVMGFIVFATNELGVGLTAYFVSQLAPGALDFLSVQAGDFFAEGQLVAYVDQPQALPAPASGALLGLGCVVGAVVRRRSRRS